MTHSTTSLRDALYALSLAQRIPDAAVLDDLVRRYPEHAEALTDFAIEFAVDALRDDPVEEAAQESANSTKLSPAVSRAISRFQNRLYAVQNAAPPAIKNPTPEAAAVPNPFASLDRASFRQLTKSLQANNVFVLKLRDRQIEADTIPDGFCRLVASELQVSPDVIDAHFAAASQLGAQQQHFKAEIKPEAGAKQSFNEAVKTSGLSDEQQRYLLAL